MATEGPLPLADIARDVLLDHLSRGDTRHALQLLVSGLGAALGGACGLVALAADGSERWRLGSADAPLALPLERLSQRLGTLQLPAGTDAAALAPLLSTAAALLLHDRDAAVSGDERAALIHAALTGADTFVWEWDIDSDWLSDIDEGLQLLGYPTHGVGHTQDDWNRLIHPDDRGANHEAYLRHARGETDSYEHAYRALAADGRWRWLLERGRIVERHPDGRPRRMVGTQSDITERRAREAAASEATQRLARIAHHVPGMLFQYRRAADGSATFPYVSERCRALFGVEPGQLVRDASVLLMLLDEAERRAMLVSIGDSARTLQPWRHDFRFRHADGGERWMRGEASPLRQDDGSTLWHGYIEDATERRELEHARAEAAAAAAANRAKTEFLSRMSHELRTPLNAVLGFTQLIEIDRNDPPSEGQLRRLKLIREAGAHLLQMIGDLLDLTRIESGGMALQIEAIDLRAVADEALAMVRDSAEKAQLVLQPLAEGGDVIARADRTRVRQVLLNLLSNAIKYNKPGGSVELRLVRLDEREVLISVRDTGIGIAEGELPRLFEPFYRSPQAGSAIEGAGIGLSVTHALVSLMGGRIDVASEAGAGSTFGVTLPAA